MSFKVKADFRDKFTKKLYKKGDSYTHKDEKRITFLIEKGFLEPAESQSENTKEQELEQKEDATETSKKKAKK